MSKKSSPVLNDYTVAWQDATGKIVIGTIIVKNGDYSTALSMISHFARPKFIYADLSIVVDVAEKAVGYAIITSKGMEVIKPFQNDKRAER